MKSTLSLLAFVCLFSTISHAQTGQVRIGTIITRQAELPEWYYRLGTGSQLQSVVVDPSVAGTIYKDTNGNVVDADVGGRLFNESLTAGTQKFNQHVRTREILLTAKDPKELLPQVQGTKTIYVIGATWCGYCKPNTGHLVEYVTRANQAGQKIRIVYVEFTSHGARLLNEPVMQLLSSRNAFPAQLVFPSFVVEDDSGILTFEQTDLQLREIISYRGR